MTEKIRIYPTLVWYYFICPREVWLQSRQLNPDEQNDFLDLGRLIHETTYDRNKKEVQLDNAKFDLVKRKDGEYIIGEIKKSSKFIESATMQLAYYLYLLRQKGIDARGEILIPKEKEKVQVELTPETETKLLKALEDIQFIVSQDCPPRPIRIKYCPNCAYKEFCWS